METIEKLKQKSLFIVIMKNKIMPETNSDVFVYDIIKSFMKEYNGIDKQME